MSPLTPLSHFTGVTYLLIAWPASEIEPSTVLGDTGDLLTMHALISLQTPIKSTTPLKSVYAAGHFILAFCILTNDDVSC